MDSDWFKGVSAFQMVEHFWEQSVSLLEDFFLATSTKVVEVSRRFRPKLSSLDILLEETVAPWKT